MIELISSWESIGREWDNLALSTGAVPFLRPGWLRAWWHAFGRGDPSLIVLRREGRLSAVMPLAARGRTIASPTNWHTPVFGPVAEDEESARTLLAGLLEAGPRRVRLDFLDPTGPGLAQIDSLSSRYRLETRTLLRSPYLRVEGHWDDYLASLPGKYRQSLRRTRKHLDALGEVRLDVRDGSEDLDRLLAEGLEVEALGWKAERGTAIASRPETRRFYRELAAWASREGILRLAFLRVNEKAIAFDFALETEDAYWLLKTGYDPGLRRLAPGRLLAREMLERAFRLRLGSYEFLGAADSHKLRWTSTCRDLVQAQFFATSISGRLDRLVQGKARTRVRRLRDRASA